MSGICDAFCSRACRVTPDRSGVRRVYATLACGVLRYATGMKDAVASERCQVLTPGMKARSRRRLVYAASNPHPIRRFAGRCFDEHLFESARAARAGNAEASAQRSLWSARAPTRAFLRSSGSLRSRDPQRELPARALHIGDTDSTITVVLPCRPVRCRSRLLCPSLPLWRCKRVAICAFTTSTTLPSRRRCAARMRRARSGSSRTG